MTKQLFADFVILSANIWTMNKEKPKAEAIAIYQDTIMKVGSNEKIEDLVGSETKVIALNGESILPGFIDAHTHIAWNGMDKVYLDLGPTKSLQEAVDFVQNDIKTREPGEWVIGRSWDQSDWPEQRYITAEDLDPISPENPVILRHVSGHFETVNTLGFKRLNLDKNQTGVDLDDEGNPVGTLRDIDLSDKQEIRPKFDDFIKGLNYGMEECLSLGITSVHDNITFENLPAYKYLSEKNELLIRVYGIIYEDMIDDAIKLGLDRSFGDKWFRIGACKLMTDGAMSSRTAYLYEDYSDMENEKGFALYDEQKLDEMVSKVHNANLQIAAHAIGDKAIANLITAIMKNIDPEECKQALHRIEHAELLLLEDVERSKEYGLVYSMQPNFVWRWGMVGVNGMYEQRVGIDRTMINNPFRWVLDNDLIVVFGSDGMPLGPLYGIKGAIYHPNEKLRLSLEEAIRCYTLYPAIVSREEKLKGSIEEGKLADLVILSLNLDSIKLEEFHDVEVKRTIVGGKVAYEK
ncbi:MAG: amidohydrolase [Candidatus Heimdallarchaeota archaeon]|nr:amidohydrolase [Candidatus Heimdallarchaeota archaeon]